MPQHRTRPAGGAPAVSDQFIGRERELDRIATLLMGSARLITIIGPGGIGKTRLAAESGYRFHRARNVPVRWVRLAKLPKGADAAAVEDEVVQSVIHTDFSGRSSRQALVDSFDRVDAIGRAQQTVLILDNCEHVLTGVGAVIADLLDAAPGLTVLATSREPIRLVDEALVQLPPLPRRQAVTLFMQRAELTGRTIEDDQADVVASICDHLHSFPLYIRLAAARLRRQPLSTILSDLSGKHTDRRLNWSPNPHIDADERHQGIADVIAWSYELCGHKERLLFERMSVFAAGYGGNPDDPEAGATLALGTDLEAITAICADATDDGLAPDEIENLLERLTDQSLVTIHFTTDTVRYSLLESLRVFARQRLCERDGDEQQRLADRHRRYYREKLAATTDWFNENERQFLDWARLAWDDLILAMDGSLSTPGGSVAGLEIAAGMISLRVPFFKGSLREARRWTERTLEASYSADPQPVELQISAMASIAWICLCQGLPDEAERMLERAIIACGGDTADLAALRADPTVDPNLPAPVEFAFGSALMLVHSDVRALHMLARAREKFAAVGHSGGVAMAELFEALTAAFLGTAEQALRITRRHLDNATRSGAEWAKSWAEIAWLIAQTKYGDPERTVEVGRGVLTRQVAMRDHWGAVWTVHARTWTLARLLADEPKTAARSHARAVQIARLLGGAAALRTELGVDITYLTPFAAETEQAVKTTRRMLGGKAFEAAWREGATLRPVLDGVTRLALGTLSADKLPAEHRSVRPQATPWPQLSEAEQEVAVLAAAGWPNTAIAARRGSSHRTVDAQVAAILKKLTITSRTEILALVPADRRDRIAREQRHRPRRPQRRGA
ncbi:ATP-binding protein [Nocardia africana]|uniref:ATP-binding protein n=1 Tax=Nocardia africana TaxID=134964 RepID=A0ABW6NSV5_9NOCA